MKALKSSALRLFLFRASVNLEECRGGCFVVVRHAEGGPLSCILAQDEPHVLEARLKGNTTEECSRKFRGMQDSNFCKVY